MKLKQQLRFYLDRQKMSAAELARKSSVSKQVISVWLGGSSPKNVVQVKLVAEALGTTVDNLLFGHGENQDEKKVTELEALLGSEWIGGVFEVKLRRVPSK